jgi:hypothetical protein
MQASRIAETYLRLRFGSAKSGDEASKKNDQSFAKLMMRRLPTYMQKTLHRRRHHAGCPVPKHTRHILRSHFHRNTSHHSDMQLTTSNHHNCQNTITISHHPKAIRPCGTMSRISRIVVPSSEMMRKWSSTFRVHSARSLFTPVQSEKRCLDIVTFQPWVFICKWPYGVVLSHTAD